MSSLQQSFASLKLRDELLKNIASLGYESMTPIQAQSLPIMLEGKDVIAQAKTGSGKTAAFGLSLLNQLDPDLFTLQALVLCPTRELADQVSQAIRQLARLMPNIKVLNLSGGIPMRPQTDSLRHGAHIIVGTPGRIQKHLDKDAFSLEQLKTLVLDEADRMLDMGFFDEIKKIIFQCPKQRHTLLFSATFPAEIKTLAEKFMIDPIRVEVEQAHTELDIEQQFYEARNQDNKFSLLKSLLLHYQPTSALIFCNTKELTTRLAGMLAKEGFSAIALNGDMDQIQRDVAMIRFSNQSCSILIATDVAARGLDIKELPMVINYDLAIQSEVHIHRVGRTGRAGSKGIAISLTSPEEGERLVAIQKDLTQPLVWGNIKNLNNPDKRIIRPEMITLCLNAGKKEKIRPGDILGALTKDAGLDGSRIGKINITALYSYVAIHISQIDQAYRYFENGKLKGKKVNIKRLN